MGGSTRDTSARVVQMGKQQLKCGRGKSHFSVLSEKETLCEEPQKRCGRTGKSSGKAHVGRTVVQKEEPWAGTSAVEEPEVRAGWRCDSSPRHGPEFRAEESDGGEEEGKGLHVLMA